VLRALGGSQADVGYAPAANSFAYMIALLLTGSLLGHLDVKFATQAATGIALLATSAMIVAVCSGDADGEHQAVWIWTIIVSGGLGGAAMALYWPFLMSWVSGDFEGRELNRRFGRYNGSWSGGALVGPLIGTWLVAQGTLYPMVAAAVCSVASLVLLRFAPKAAVRSEPSARIDGPPPETVPDVRMLAGYRWISRMALFCSWASFAIIRSQFALLFTELGYSKPQFGVLLTIFATCNFLALIGAGRWTFWHFRRGPIIGAQLMLLVSLLMIVYGRSLLVFYLAPIILGLGFGFAYSSHLYYGASTSRRRSVRMAIHEIVISVGITIGAGVGGVLAKNVGAYAPYWFAIALVCLGAVVQVGIHVALGTGRAAHGRPETSA
jgi:MFS family permease